MASIAASSLDDPSTHPLSACETTDFMHPPPEDASVEEIFDYLLWLIEDHQLLKASVVLDKLEAHPDILSNNKGAAITKEELPQVPDMESRSVHALSELLATRGLPHDKFQKLRKFPNFLKFRNFQKFLKFRFFFRNFQNFWNFRILE